MTASNYLTPIQNQVVDELRGSSLASQAIRVHRCSYSGRRCHQSQACPVCSYSAALTRRVELDRAIVQAGRDGARLIPLTLSSPEVPVHSVKDAIQRTRERFGDLSGSIRGVVGSALAIEATPSKRFDGHDLVHGHGWLVLDPGQNRGRDYSSVTRLHEQWAQLEPGGDLHVSSLDRFTEDGQSFEEWAASAQTLPSPVAPIDEFTAHRRWSTYSLKATPLYTVDRFQAQMAENFVERLQQTRGLHMYRAAGVLSIN